MAYPVIVIMSYHKDFNIAKIAGLRAGLSGPHPHVMAYPVLVIMSHHKDFNITKIAGLRADLSGPHPHAMAYLFFSHNVSSQGFQYH